jgi:hypothetical protein
MPGMSKFLRHFTEMFVAMGLGMLVLAAPVEAVLHPVTAVSAAVMAVSMTVPMAWWMHHRRHPLRDNLEMAGTMVVPTIAAIALYWLGALGSHGVMMVQHAVMIPAMAAVMIWQWRRPVLPRRPRNTVTMLATSVPAESDLGYRFGRSAGHVPGATPS